MTLDLGTLGLLNERKLGVTSDDGSFKQVDEREARLEKR